MQDYEVSRTIGKCSVSGKTFEEGEEFYSVVLDDKEGLHRCDYSVDAWEGPPEGTLCYCKTALPVKNEQKKTFVDDEVILDFFLRLGGADDRLKQRFRFVLSLILMRKRILKYVKTIRESDREYWEMRLVRDKTRYRVFNPVLDEHEIEDVSVELSTILHGSYAVGDAAAGDCGRVDAPGTDGCSPTEPIPADVSGGSHQEGP